MFNQFEILPFPSPTFTYYILEVEGDKNSSSSSLIFNYASKCGHNLDLDTFMKIFMQCLQSTKSLTPRPTYFVGFGIENTIKIERKSTQKMKQGEPLCFIFFFY